MRIYFVYSGSHEDILREENVPVMVSYGRYRNPKLLHGFPEILIDSGGFQIKNNTNFKRIWPHSYFNYAKRVLKTYGNSVKGFVVLDIIDQEETFENNLYMLHYGLPVVPVWRGDWTEELLEHYCKHYLYVAIGCPYNEKKGAPYYRDLVTRLITKYPQTRFHVFGIGLTAISAFTDIKPYSVDCSTWSVPDRFGNDIVFDGKQLKEVPLTEKLKERVKEHPEFSDFLTRKALKTINSFGGN